MKGERRVSETHNVNDGGVRLRPYSTVLTVHGTAAWAPYLRQGRSVGLLLPCGMGLRLLQLDLKLLNLGLGLGLHCQQLHPHA
jgi:hypothetical protein